MIKEMSGDLLRAPVEALVNTVNTHGVMGKGIALQFKRVYPAMYDEYRRAAKAGELRLGQVTVWPTGQLAGPKYIVNFPTKGHWKSKSRIDDIRAGLEDLVSVVRVRGITSIAVPPLGCGNGGLAWEAVLPLIEEAFAALPEVEVQVFPPRGAPKAAEMVTGGERPSMTLGRACLVELLSGYEQLALLWPGLIETQKLMYFLQEAGEPLRLKFERAHYGPYADNLRHVLALVEGHFLRGYADGSAKVGTEEPLEVIPGAREEAQMVLTSHVETRERLTRVLELARGFESSYGMELLATVHWVITRQEPTTDAELATGIWQWSPRKARLFTENHIQTALRQLRSHGWVPAAV